MIPNIWENKKNPNNQPGMHVWWFYQMGTWTTIANQMVLVPKGNNGDCP